MNIEKARRQAGLTQKELCQRVGISVKSLNNYIRGRTPLPSGVLISICRECGCSADYVLGLKEHRERRWADADRD